MNEDLAFALGGIKLTNNSKLQLSPIKNNASNSNNASKPSSPIKTDNIQKLRIIKDYEEIMKQKTPNSVNTSPDYKNVRNGTKISVAMQKLEKLMRQRAAKINQDDQL